MKIELSFNDVYAYLEALKTINVKGFKLNYAINKNLKTFESEMKSFRETLEKEKPESIRQLEQEQKTEGKDWDNWNKKVGKLAENKVELDLFEINQDYIPDDIDTKTFRILSIFLNE